MYSTNPEKQYADINISKAVNFNTPDYILRKNTSDFQYNSFNKVKIALRVE